MSRVAGTGQLEGVPLEGIKDGLLEGVPLEGTRGGIDKWVPLGESDSDESTNNIRGNNTT